jgi:hypothetical protein
MPLMRHNGILLRNSAGALACTEADCCDVPPCPDCCIEITSGVFFTGPRDCFPPVAIYQWDDVAGEWQLNLPCDFPCAQLQSAPENPPNEGGSYFQLVPCVPDTDNLAFNSIRVFTFNSPLVMEITITTSSDTRVVCDGESIVLTIKIRNAFAALNDYPMGNLTVLFDPVWNLKGHVPSDAITTSGPGGFVFWSSKSEGEYEVTLQFSPCYFNFYSDLGAIVVRFEGEHSIEEVIAIERCNPLLDCCTMPARCKPCCLLLDPFAGDIVRPDHWVWNEELGRFEWLQILVFNDRQWYVLLWIKPANPKGDEESDDWALWCFNETWDFGLDISPSNLDSIDPQFNIIVEACEFGLDGEPTPDATITNDPLLIEWPYPAGASPLEYRWSLLRDCEFIGCDTIRVEIIVAGETGDRAIDFVIGLFECDTPEGTDCFTCDDVYGGGEGCCKPLPESLRVSWTCGDIDYSVVCRNVTPGVECPNAWNWPLLPGGIATYCTDPPPPTGFLPKAFYKDFSNVCVDTCAEVCRIEIVKILTGWQITFDMLFAVGPRTSAILLNDNCLLPIEIDHCGITYTIEKET